MTKIRSYLLLFALLLCATLTPAQRVAVVFSGGGARGLVHLGVLKALEENSIPIDVITGTSIGAIVGGMYASGYTIDEIVERVKSDDFKRWSTGEFEQEFNYYYKKQEQDAEMFAIRINLGREQKGTFMLPTSLVPSYQMDLAIVHFFSRASAACRNDFDSLMIPFRAMSYDVYNKKPYCPQRGDLSTVIRASMSFPGIFKATVIDSLLLFDGGIVDNFPVNVAIEKFSPDFILGVNCSYNYAPPTEDDVISQLVNLTSNLTNYDIPPEKGFVIDLDSLPVGLMDFNAVDVIMKAGYDKAMAEMPRIKERVTRRISAEELAKKRADFNVRKPPLVFKNVSVSGGSGNIQSYVKDELRSISDTTFTFEELRTRYFGVISDEGVNTFFPSARYNPETSLYDLHIRLSEAPKFKLGIGGNYSSFSNLAFVSFAYSRYAPVSTKLLVNMYLGSVYNSQKLHARFDTRFRRFNIPLFLEATATHSTYDYYSKNPGLVYEDTKPDFIQDREVFGRINIGTKLFANSLIKVGYTYANIFENYYTTKEFSSKDIPENMRFEASSFRAKIEYNTFDYKMFPTKGSFLRLTFNYVNGLEYHRPGTTSQEYMSGDTAVIYQGYRPQGRQNLWVLRFKHEQFVRPLRHVGLGYHLESAMSNQALFRDYYSTLLMLPAFEPLPNFQGLFLENYRSNIYFAVGVKPTYYYSDRIFIRGELYAFQPISMLNKDNTMTAVKPKYQWSGKTFYIFGASSLVFQTPLGPISLMAAYYQKDRDHLWEDIKSNLYFSVNFGFYLFNSRALD